MTFNKGDLVGWESEPRYVGIVTAKEEDGSICVLWFGPDLPSNTPSLHKSWETRVILLSRPETI
jgi:hypothetical protein